MKDRFSRSIDYIRVSITDRCNLRCIYCMPEQKIQLIRHKDILRYEEIIRIVSIAAKLGVKNLRITGGEPLVRKDLPELISSLNQIQGINDISLTTNGILLKKNIHSLVLSGLKRLNISLDSIVPSKYKEITRGGDLKEVMEGINEAEKAGLLPIKINIVPVRGINDDEIEDFARLTFKKPYHIRFIEFMPIGNKDFWNKDKYISTDEIKDKVSKIAPIEEVVIKKTGPAQHFRFKDAPGVLGFISPISNHFCYMCNRLRLTSDGKLRPCLFSETEIDLKSVIRQGAQDDEIKRLLKLAIEVKPKSHSINATKNFDYLKPMSKIGG